MMILNIIMAGYESYRKSNDMVLKMTQKLTIDLRSDTVTKPTDEMREAMYRAEVGDDVFGEDPTVNLLEEKTAHMLGKESALFVPSGSMANTVCLLSHCQRGDEIIVGNRSHIFLHEAGGTAVIGGIHSNVLQNQPDGTLDLEDISEAIRDDDIHHPPTRLICLENTHNFCGGVPLSMKYIKAVAEIAGFYGLLMHLDGARVFNAAVALDVDVKDIAQYFHSISFCLSKGLGSPVGSMVCGDKDFIDKARRARKMLGGGMRQAGILAAAGLISLEKMTLRLGEDHYHAELLAQGIDKISGLKSEELANRTNILFFGLLKGSISAQELVKRAESKGLKLMDTGNNRFRMVVHYSITSEMIHRTQRILKNIMKD